MPLIECTLRPADITILSTNYSFRPNEAGKFVAMVHNDDHAAVMLSVEHYRLADENEGLALGEPVPLINDAPHNREGYAIEPMVTAEVHKIDQARSQRGRRRGRA